MNHPSENVSSSDHFSGFNKLNHEELLARGMMSDAFSMDMSQWQAPEPEDLENLLTGYQVLGFLGRGGMGAVYRVLQPDLERECALKLLPLEVSIAPGFEQRFLSEARAMAKLDHPNIVTIYDFGRTTEGHLYYVMECVEGTDLHALIKDGGLDISGALDVVSQVCEALDYAHTAGYVHRDIKPANILVNTKGMVKVTDFGLAKLLNPTPNNSPDYGMTMTGQVMGTPDYMAPEQASGQAVDQRADIYALGVLLYEMLTGSLPKGIFSPPSQKVAVDIRVDEVVIRALQQEPEKRYQQASEIKTSIDNIRNKPDSSDQEEHIQELVEEQLNTHPETATTHPESPQKPKKNLIPIIAGCAILLIGIITWFTLRSDNKTSNNPPHSTTSKTSNTPPPDTSLWPVQDEKHTNTLGIPFVPVSGTDVLFSVWETRRKDWDKFLRETDYHWERPSFNGPGDHPAPNISWHDANAYCKWLTEKERASGNIGPDMEYRLPTDLEWSAAVGLGKEEGNDPEQRSGKVKNVYPWGKAWPAPEEVKGEVDGGDPVTISTAILDGFHLFSKIHTNHWKYSDYAGKAWYNVRPLVQNCSHRIYDVYKPIFGILGLRKHIFFHVDDKTFVVLPNAIMGHITDFMIHVTGWEYAYWNDPSFRKAISEGNIKLDLNSEYWTGAKWINDKWIYKNSVYERTLFSDDQSYKKNLALVVKYNKDNLTYFSDTSSKIHKTIIVFKGTLSKEQINAEMALGFNKFKKLWEDGATKIIDELLPKYENDWQQKIQPVEQLWENPFGIKGLAGSQREWVWDKYYKDDQFFGPRTLRGGSLRSKSRGPETQNIKLLHRDWIQPASYFYQWTPLLKEESLSSYRNSHQPHIRKQWYGFRPVLAFQKIQFPTTLEEADSPIPTMKNSIGIHFKPLQGSEILMSVYETTNGQFQKYKPNNVNGDLVLLSEKDGGYWKQHPVRGVNWVEANKFCDWLTKKERNEKNINSNQRYRLPYKSEWNLMNIGQFPTRHDTRWVDNFTDPTRCKATGIDYHAWAEDGFINTAPVGSFRNKNGFYDAGGNLREWCLDENESGAKYVIDYPFDHDWQARWRKPTEKLNNVGFRLVLETLSSNP